MSEHTAAENKILLSVHPQEWEPCSVLHLTQQRYYLTVNMWCYSVAFNVVIDSTLKVQWKQKDSLTAKKSIPAYPSDGHKGVGTNPS